VTESDNIALHNGQTSLNSLRYDSKPAGITTAPDGTPWFVESDPGNPGYRIARASGRGYVEYPIQPCVGTPCSGSYTGTGPTDVAVALDGSIWFTNQLHNEVGRLDTNAGTFTNYSLPAIDAGLAKGQARAISVAQDGTLWVAEYGGISYAKRQRDHPHRSHAAGADRDGLPPGLRRLPARGGARHARQRVVLAGHPHCARQAPTLAHEYVTGFPGTHSRAASVDKAKKKAKPVILGQTRVTLRGGQHRKITITLNAKGRKLLKSKGRPQV